MSAMPIYLARTDAGLVVSCWIVMRPSKDSCQANRDAFTQVSRSPEVKVRLRDGERATAEKFKEFCKGKIAHDLGALPRVCRRSRVLSYSPTWTLCDEGILPCGLQYRA
jgi:hypothetical protein